MADDWYSNFLYLHHSLLMMERLQKPETIGLNNLVMAERTNLGLLQKVLILLKMLWTLAQVVLL